MLHPEFSPQLLLICFWQLFSQILRSNLLKLGKKSPFLHTSTRIKVEHVDEKDQVQEVLNVNTESSLHTRQLRNMRKKYYSHDISKDHPDLAKSRKRLAIVDCFVRYNFLTRFFKDE